MDSTLRTERTAVEVARPLTFWQQLRLHLGDLLLILTAAFIAYKVVRWKFF